MESDVFRLKVFRQLNLGGPYEKKYKPQPIDILMIWEVTETNILPILSFAQGPCAVCVSIGLVAVLLCWSEASLLHWG